MNDTGGWGALALMTLILLVGFLAAGYVGGAVMATITP